MVWIFRILTDAIVHWFRGMVYVSPLILVGILTIAFLPAKFIGWAGVCFIFAVLPAYCRPHKSMILGWAWRRLPYDSIAGWWVWPVTIAWGLVSAFVGFMVLIILVFLVGLGSPTVLSGVSEAQSQAYAYGLSTLMVLVVTWALGRLSVALPAAVAQRRFVVLEAWNWTRPVSGKVFGIVVIMFAVVLGVRELALMAPNVLTNQTANSFLGMVSVLLYLSVWVELYQRVMPTTGLEN